MKEQKKTTELVEQETTEEIIVCNGCGEEVENSKEFESWQSEMLLHFCNDCLPEDDSEALTGKLAYRVPNVPPENENNVVYIGLAVSGALYAFLSGLLPNSSLFLSLLGYGSLVFVGLLVSALLIGLVKDNSRATGRLKNR